MQRPDKGVPQHIPRHMKLMADLMIMAFQMDHNRVATCILNNDLSQMNFGFLDGVSGSLQLDLTRNGRNPDLKTMSLKTNQFHVQQLVYLIERMKRLPEGDSTLLDHCLLLFCSNLFEGDRHQTDEMPMILAGCKRHLPVGSVVDVFQRPKQERKACLLYLSLMQKMGRETQRFGDVTKGLEGV